MKRQKISIIYLLIIMLFMLSGCTTKSMVLSKESTGTTVSTQIKAKAASLTADKALNINSNGKLSVDYIDVGQGDSILISQGKHSMLIDAGNNEDGSLVSAYIRSRGITKLDYIIGTHPHEDHIGGMDVVIKSFQIGKVYLPKVTINTRTFEDVVAAINGKGLKINNPVPGSSFQLGNASVNILGPLDTKESDLNTYSIVTKVKFGSNSFLFTGDAQISNEEAMIRKGYDLKADVLKVGHHGSDTSTGRDFLNKVQPKYAVISCGRGNSYGHPHAETMDELRNKNIKLLRTDEQGTIIAVSDGKNITFNKKPADYKYGEQISKSSKGGTETAAGNVQKDSKTNKNKIVYWTASGKSYHYDRNCSTLKRSKHILSGPFSKCPKKDPCDVCVK